LKRGDPHLSAGGVIASRWQQSLNLASANQPTKCPARAFQLL